MPTFDIEKIHNTTYYVTTAGSPPVTVAVASAWPRGDNNPVETTDRVFWANKPAPDGDKLVDARFNLHMVYNFVPYAPNPNDGLAPGLVWPMGERQEVVTPILKDNDTLLQIALAQMAYANETWFQGEDRQTLAEAVAAARAKTVKGAGDLALIARYAPYEAAVQDNLAMLDSIRLAIQGGTEFTFDGAWVYGPNYAPPSTD